MRTVDPIRRGLRLAEIVFFHDFLFIPVRTVDPIRRGLRLVAALARHEFIIRW